MAAEVFDVLTGLDRVVGGRILRSPVKARAAAVGVNRRAVLRWISWVAIAAIVCALAGHWLSNPVSARSGSPRTITISLPAPLDFGTGPVVVNAEDPQAIAAIASAVKGSLRPVAVAAYAGRSGNRERNLRLAQKHASEVREALVEAGVPTLRVLVVSPTFVAADEASRVEVSLVQAVPAFFPVQPGVDAMNH